MANIGFAMQIDHYAATGKVSRRHNRNPVFGNINAVAFASFPNGRKMVLNIMCGLVRNIEQHIFFVTLLELIINRPRHHITRRQLAARVAAEDFAEDVVLLELQGVKPIVVHGGAGVIERAHGSVDTRIGKTAREGLRQEDVVEAQAGIPLLESAVSSGEGWQQRTVLSMGRLQLLTEAMQCFFELRELPGLKKKPSTSELIDWLKLLVAEDIPVEALQSKDDKVAVPPLVGALLKNEQDVSLFERLVYMARQNR